MILVAYILLLIVIMYATWLLIISFYWNKSKNNFIVYNNIPVSIIIPFRNEEQNLKACIDSILNQNYDASVIEIILVDDHSSDKSIEIASSLANIKLLQLPENVIGKKNAITYGIQHASHEIIITRDADTTCSTTWLQLMMSNQKQYAADMVIGQVMLKNDFSFLAAIQILEQHALTVITGGTANMKKPILCNAANLLFTKTIFNRVNGFTGNDFIASGDDVFLLNKIIDLKTSTVTYLKNSSAAVMCDTEKSFSKMIQQRIRWASKNKHNNNVINAFTAVLVISANISWVIFGFLSLFYNELTSYFLITAILKCLIDFLLLFLASSFYKQTKLLWWFPLFFCVYPVELIAIMFLTLPGKIKWKDRIIQ